MPTHKSRYGLTARPQSRSISRFRIGATLFVTMVVIVGIVVVVRSGSDTKEGIVPPPDIALHMLLPASVAALPNSYDALLKAPEKQRALEGRFEEIVRELAEKDAIMTKLREALASERALRIRAEKRVVHLRHKGRRRIVVKSPPKPDPEQERRLADAERGRRSGLSLLQVAGSGRRGAANMLGMPRVHTVSNAPMRDARQNAGQAGGIIRPASPYVVAEGDIIPAALETGINSDLPGPLKARVTSNVYDSQTGTFLLIPQGSVITGRYQSNVAYGQKRVFFTGNLLRFPNGRSVILKDMPGVDLAGFSGIRDKVNTHFGRVLAATFFGSALNIGARASTGSVTGLHPTLGQEFTRDFGSGVAQAGQEIVKRELRVSPTITVRPGTTFNIFVMRDLVLEPYKE